jgi:hypothetical protein
VSLASFQKDLPNLPVDGIRVTLRLSPHKVSRVTRLPDGRVVPHETTGDEVRFTAPRLETLSVLSVETS